MGRIKKEEKARRQTLFDAGYYQCHTCGEVKTLDQYRKSSRAAGNAFGISTICTPCGNAYHKEWADNNREKARKATREHARRERAANLDAVRARENTQRRKRRREVPELVRARDRARRANNPLAHRLSDHKRKARTKDGGLTPEQVRAVFRHYLNRCLCCGSPSNLAIDHIVPLSHGGEHEVWNIQPLCVSCNSSKGARRSTDYRPDKGISFRKVM